MKIFEHNHLCLLTNWIYSKDVHFYNISYIPVIISKKPPVPALSSAGTGSFR